MPARDFLADADNDIAFTGGDFAMAGSTPEMTAAESKAADLAAVGQGIKTRLLLFLGEYWLDQSKGVPWLEQILIKNPSGVAVNAIFRAAILDTPDVVSVIDISFELDAASRTATVRYAVVTTFSDQALAGEVSA